MKYLIFDAGPIISLTMNGMLGVVEKLKGVFDGEFVLTPAVKREVVDRPMGIKKFKLEAIQVRDLVDRGMFKMATEIVGLKKLERETKRILKVANGVLRMLGGRRVNLIQEGEASCLAFSKLCGKENVIVVDERTTRMLSEAPGDLEKMMERKLHIDLKANLSSLKELNGFKFIRSSELLYVAWKKKLVGIDSRLDSKHLTGQRMEKDKELLDALLYGVKFKGCAISSGEIEEIVGR